MLSRDGGLMVVSIWILFPRALVRNSIELVLARLVIRNPVVHGRVRLGVLLGMKRVR